MKFKGNYTSGITHKSNAFQIGYSIACHKPNMLLFNFIHMDSTQKKNCALIVILYVELMYLN